ncbi:helix-turn-helix domain-containing protein [Actinomadura sp. ATCC 31491]|uniref:Helix-turn-helix domain-containing protein n=1 Tax=Actinomadura luzonensis TaxID=2805427 RepID=A0ABT0G563_9ACTN|nr:helix-turn-helix transcriptional regulator [Actinomadura luzonensis]MCK2219746.1 helix-turn-helix domain-containing protein [Actinomadura luzonensis]
MTQPIHLQLRALRREMRLRRKDLAAQIGVYYNTISSWDTGRKAPFTHHAHAYARAVHHHLVAIDPTGTIVGNLIDLMPKLPAMRRQRGLSQQMLSHHLRTTKSAVSSLEVRIHAGDSILLTTLEGYLLGFNLSMALVPAERAERAA